MAALQVEKKAEMWRANLFGCFNMGIGNCLYAWCCPCCAMATARTNMDGSNWCFNCLCIASPAMGYNVIREGYHIHGDCCTDQLLTCFCPSCATCQMLHESNLRGKLEGGARAASPEPWRHSIIDCSNCGNCFFACCCPVCALASARTNYDGSNFCFNCCNLSHPLGRSVIRTGYNIEGTCIGDICWPCCCQCCSLAQLLTEVQDRGKVTKSFVVVAK